jgi:hypothetical protein
MKKAVVEQMASLITAAFGLVAALAWNGAIQAIFKHFLGDPGTLSAMIYYAVIVTIIAVIATMWVGRVLGKLK